jgi:threonine dehydratase
VLPSPDVHDPDQEVRLADVRAAAERLRGIALRTPLLPFDDRPSRVSDGPRVWLKPENLQPIGAFKIRGAYNALSQLSAAERAAGVVSHSSGNHAQGIARAARLLGIRSIIVMPRGASAVKVAGVRADGAAIEFVSDDNEARIARAEELAQRDGLALVPSFDDARIVAGQGSVGLEIVEQLAELGADGPLTVLVPVGGGGLSAGICVAVKGIRPEARVIGVEPASAADAADSLREDRIVRWSPELTGRTIADGARTSALGRIPFAHLRRLLDGVVTVSDDDLKVAMYTAAVRARLVVEPTGALALAAWLRGPAPQELRGPAAQELRSAATSEARGDVVIVISGGNVEMGAYRGWLADAEALSSDGHD